MSNGSKPRSLPELEDLATVRQTVYRLAIGEALSELRPHTCGGCQRAKNILEGVDRPRVVYEPVAVPVQREPEHDDMVMTAFDVSLAFRVSTQTVHDWLREGKIPPEATFLDARGRRRFHTAEIDKLLE